MLRRLGVSFPRSLDVIEVFPVVSRNVQATGMTFAGRSLEESRGEALRTSEGSCRSGRGVRRISRRGERSSKEGQILRVFFRKGLRVKIKRE